jgi:hypothetical protein
LHIAIAASAIAMTALVSPPSAAQQKTSTTPVVPRHR